MGNEAEIWVRVGGVQPVELSWSALASALVEAVRLIGGPHASIGVQMRREGAVWVVEGFGQSCRVASGRGVELLAQLVDEPGREHHVLEMCGGTTADGGDAGELLDATARDAYRARLAELRAELDEAERWHEPVRRARAQAELEALEAELARAIDLRGRSRRACNATERARSNVQRRIACAIRKVTDAAPRLGEHLAASVKTGVLCVYRPELDRGGR